MRLIHKSYKTLIAMALSVFAMGLFFQSCEKDSEFELKAFGPSEVVRGVGEIYFIGTKLDEIVEIRLPNGSTFYRNRGDFTSSSSEKITLRIPEDYPLGLSAEVIVYKLANGETRTTKGRFMVFSSIVINSIELPSGEDEPLKPGDEITLRGVNLKEVLAVVFKNGTAILYTDFKSQTDDAITIELPYVVGSGVVSIVVGIDENNQPTFVTGPEITVIDPKFTYMNGEELLRVASPDEIGITLTGEYFGGIDLANGLPVVNFESGEPATVTAFDVENNTLTFNMPTLLNKAGQAISKLKTGQEISVTVNANSGKEITSTAKFIIAETVVESHTPLLKGSLVTLTGINLQAIESVYADRSNGSAAILGPNDFEIVDSSTIRFTIQNSFVVEIGALVKYRLLNGEIHYLGIIE